MIPVKQAQNEQWDIFENAATHSYARSIVEKSKTKNSSITNENKSRSTITANEYVSLFGSEIDSSRVVLVRE